MWGFYNPLYQYIDYFLLNFLESFELSKTYFINLCLPI